MGVVAIDWDNTLVFATEWLEGAKDSIRLLREKGHKVVIHSCNRASYIDKMCREAGIVVDRIWDANAAEDEKSGKPLADLYVDDKGYHFPHNGSWVGEMPKILERLTGLDNRKW